MTTIPRLETNRLILRAMRIADWPAYASMMGSARAAHMGGPFSAAEAWGMFCADHALWEFYGHGALMLEHRAAGACLGQVGINAGPRFPECELGWIIYPEAEGQGYAYEAACALRNWAFKIRRLPTLVSYIDPENLRSRRLAERLGARIDPDAPGQDPTDLVYRHPAP